MKSDDFAVYYIDEIGLWRFRKPWHTHDVAGNGYDEFGPVVDDQVVYFEVET